MIGDPPSDSGAFHDNVQESLVTSDAVGADGGPGGSASSTASTSGVFRMCERRGPRESGGPSPSGVQGQSPSRSLGNEVP